MLGVALVFGSVMHAAGHAVLAGAAGVLARALAASGPMDVGSTALFGLFDSRTAAFALALLGLLAACAKLVGGACAAWAEARVAGEVGARVRLAVLEDVLAVGNGAAPRGAERLAALTTHVRDVEHGVSHGVLAELRAWVQLAPLAVLLVALAPRLAGSAVVALAGFAVFAFAVRRAFKRAHVRAASATGALVAAADEAVRHAELWATYGAQRTIRAHVAKASHRIAHEGAAIRIRAAVLSSTSEVLGALALVLVLFLAWRGLLGVERGAVVPFAIAFFMAYRPLRDGIDARLARARGEEALAAALSPPVRAEGAPPRAEPVELDATRIRSTVGAPRQPLEAVVLDRVQTRYGAHAPLSVRIAPGTIAAIVGPTGSGKTTLLRALLGLEPLLGGRIMYGTRSLAGAAVGPLERPFAWVPQDAPIIGDTLAANVALGHAEEDAGAPSARALLAGLGAEGLADTLGDDVLATVRSLSGGERQWIAVARALATRLPVLLLDEPTSALDPSSQARLLAALARLRGRRTVILVTHRPEPLAIADVVVRLDAPLAATGADVRASA